MPDQLSLFPTKDLAGDAGPTLGSELNAIDEMFFASRRYRSSVEYLDLIHFIARFPKYSAFNGVLLYIQNPNITYVATAGNWWRQFRRRPKYYAKPLVILAPMSPVRFVYDIYDTEGAPIPNEPMKFFETKDRLSREVFEKIIHNCTLHGITVREVSRPLQPDENAISLTYEIRKRYEDLNIESWAKYLIPINRMDSLETKYATLTLGLGHIFCGHLGIDDNAWWQDRRDADQTKATIEAESTAYLVCLRKGLLKPAEKFLSPYNQLDQEMPEFGLNGIFHATQYVEEMGKTRWKTPKRKSRYKAE
ncbi:MAG: hypothetical protein JRF71_11465 [Deltaproteobacteria bacterium]|nr:hypothetical protein [Deltaproteobacteria bacterium]